MFQLWKFVFLCGLLTGASASLLGKIGSDLSNVLEKVDPILQNGLQIADSVIEGVGQTLTSDLNELLKSTVDSVQDLVHTVLSVEDQLLNVKIEELSILDVTVDASSDRQRLTLRFPITAKVSAVLPAIDQVDLQVSLDLLNTIDLEINAQTGLVSKVLEQCASDPASIKLSLLNRRSLTINKILDSVTGRLKRIVTLLVESQLCPLLRTVVDNLGDSLLQNIANLQNSVSLNVNV